MPVSTAALRVILFQYGFDRSVGCDKCRPDRRKRGSNVATYNRIAICLQLYRSNFITFRRVVIFLGYSSMDFPELHLRRTSADTLSEPGDRLVIAARIRLAHPIALPEWNWNPHLRLLGV